MADPTVRASPPFCVGWVPKLCVCRTWRSVQRMGKRERVTSRESVQPSYGRRARRGIYHSFESESTICCCHTQANSPRRASRRLSHRKVLSSATNSHQHYHPVCAEAATHIAGSQLPGAYGKTLKHRVTSKLTRHTSRFQAASPGRRRQQGQWEVRTALRRASGRPQKASTAPSGCQQSGIRLYNTSVNGCTAAAHFVVEDLTELDIGLNISKHDAAFLFSLTLSQ